MRIGNQDNRTNFKGNIRLDEFGDLIPMQDTSLDNAVAGKIAGITQDQVASVLTHPEGKLTIVSLNDNTCIWHNVQGEIGIKNPRQLPGILNFFSWSDCPPIGKTTYANYARAVQNIAELAKGFLSKAL